MIFIESLKRGSKHLHNSGTADAFGMLRGAQLYIANLGNSEVIIGKPDQNNNLLAKVVTLHHTPDMRSEQKRIEAMGGKVKLQLLFQRNYLILC